jgi:hypothetical protein
LARNIPKRNFFEKMSDEGRNTDAARDPDPLPATRTVMSVSAALAACGCDHVARHRQMQASSGFLELGCASRWP